MPPSAFIGDEAEYPLHLMPYASLTLSDGRGANQPWLQEVPDPMTTARWNTWVELNPSTAARFGLVNNSVVRIVSPYGELEAPVVLYPGIRPDVIAVPLGQGHQDLGRFAAGRGAQVMNLIAPDGARDELLWASTRVRLEPLGRFKTLARLENLEGEGRESIR